ncbi:hypothetical protein GQ457_03G017570 [Hibiscus cannabinus]
MNKGHVVTKKELAPRPSNRKGGEKKPWKYCIISKVLYHQPGLHYINYIVLLTKTNSSTVRIVEKMLQSLENDHHQIGIRLMHWSNLCVVCICAVVEVDLIMVKLWVLERVSQVG